MRYVALDVETTGLSTTDDQLLQLGMVLEDTATAQREPLRSLRVFDGVVAWERICGDPAALVMNGALIADIAAASRAFRKPEEREGLGFELRPNTNALWQPKRALATGSYLLDRSYYRTSADLAAAAGRWLDDAKFDGAITVAGKNVAGFDLHFIPHNLARRFRRRVIDAGSVLVDWSAETLLSLEEMIERHPSPERQSKDRRPHDAVSDCLDVISQLRLTYHR